MNNIEEPHATSPWTWLEQVVDRLILWFIARVFGVMLALFMGLMRRRRMSHNNGIAADGFLQIVDNPDIPAHQFFTPGRCFPLRIRHATATFYDDGMNGIRSMSIKFAREYFKSPFDIEMNTGATSLFWSAASFLQFARLRKGKYGIEYREYYRRYPEGLTAAQISLRRNPDSYHNLHYYCKTPFQYLADDRTRYYAKYRVKPFDDEEETGKNVDPSAGDTCNQRILPHETRGRNYLKDEYRNRVIKKGAKYRMQIQLLTASQSEDPEIFNNMVVWDEEDCPWMDLAVLEVDTVLNWADSNMSSFSLNNMPDTLGIIPAKSIYDYNSLNYMRAHSEIARKARMFAYKLFGGPKQIPDNDDRNSSKII